jgi:hypothetical protein
MATGAFFCLKQGGGADRLLGGHMKLDFHNRFILGRQASKCCSWMDFIFTIDSFWAGWHQQNFCRTYIFSHGNYFCQEGINSYEGS